MGEDISFRRGLVGGIPIALGYLAVSFGFGILAVTSGLTWYETVFISLFNVTSAGQLAAVPILVSGGSLFELALSQLVINSRYALMSVSLSQRLGKSVRVRDRFLIGFANTDEIFAVAVGNREKVGRRFMYGLILLPVLGWTVGTALGALAGAILPEIIVTALSVSLYAMFISIIVPVAKKNMGVLITVLLAALVSCAFRYVRLLSRVPSGFSIVICAVLVSALLALLCPIKEAKSDGNE